MDPIFLTLFVLISASICALMAFKAFSDGVSDAYDVYWSMGAWLLLCGIGPYVITLQNPSDSLKAIVDLYFWLCHRGGLVYIGGAALVAYISWLVADECYKATTYVHLNPRAARPTTVVNARQNSGGIFYAIAVIFGLIAIDGAYAGVKMISAEMKANPWYSVIENAKKYDKDVGATFHAETSPMNSILIPEELMDPTESAKVKAQVEASILKLKLPIVVEKIKSMIIEDRGVHTDFIVCYEEKMTPARPADNPRLRTVRFREKKKDDLLENTALAIDTLYKGKLQAGATGTSASARLGTLGIPPLGLTVVLNQHGVVTP